MYCSSPNLLPGAPQTATCGYGTMSHSPSIRTKQSMSGAPSLSARELTIQVYSTGSHKQSVLCCGPQSVSWCLTRLFLRHRCRDRHISAVPPHLFWRLLFSSLSFNLTFPQVVPLAICEEGHVKTFILYTQHEPSGTLSGLLLCCSHSKPG